MNKDRRNRLGKLIESLDAAKCELEEIKDEETEAMENIPESLQETERYEASSNAVDNLTEAYDSIESLIESINSAIE